MASCGSSPSSTSLSSARPWQIGRNGSVDPFDSLAIKMPFKSTQLFRYFYDVADTLDVAVTNPQDDCIVPVTHDPSALRNTLLIAGLHYAWNVGTISDFEATWVFHKIECIRTINEWLHVASLKSFTNCVRQIATMCLIECCTGNMQLAENHLNGLTALLTSKSRFLKLPSTDREKIGEELANRYLLLVYTFVHGFKSRLYDILEFSGDCSPRTDLGDLEPNEVNHLMAIAHEREIDGMRHRLQALRLIPAFFAPPRDKVRPHQVDLNPYLVEMREMTEMVASRQRASNEGRLNKTWDDIWVGGAATRLLLVYVNGHVQSLQDAKIKAGIVLSSWPGVTAATGLYLHGVLKLWNGGRAMESRLLGQILLILQQDLDEGRRRGHPQGRSSQSDVWFWKAFVGVLSLELGLRESGGRPLQALRFCFRENLRYWSTLVALTKWEDARAALRRMVWPERSTRDSISREIWANALGNT